MAVVDFQQERIRRQPHREGKARCLNCKHEWHAVARVGITGLECPNCRTGQGLFDGLSTTEHAQWRCDCGEYVFFIDVRGPYCAHCGRRPDL